MGLEEIKFQGTKYFAHLCAKPQQHMTSSSSNHHFYSRKSTRKSNGSAQGTDKSLKLPQARAIVAMPTSSVELLRYVILIYFDVNCSERLSSDKDGIFGETRTVGHSGFLQSKQK